MKMKSIKSVNNRAGYYTVFTTKRAIDLVASTVGIVLLVPLLIIIALAIKVDNPGPVFFRQERVGKDSRFFKIFKFRTMVVGAEKKGAGICVNENDERITRVGYFLRKNSLDELPQLFNVFKGEMSLVGPRPTLPYQVEKYDREQLRRLLVKPGITGWAQVKGRNAISWPERIEYDIWYIDNWSFWLDLKIIFLTMLVVLKKKDLYRSDGSEDPISRMDNNNPNEKE
jgi:undecaprenyl phosphate N,N'-diacetylbacillosamine 1-phosphate transferase